MRGDEVRQDNIIKHSAGESYNIGLKSLSNPKGIR